MNEKKVMVLIFGLVVLVAIIGLVLFFQSEKTGGFNIRMPMSSGKAVKRTPLKIPRDRVITPREPKEEILTKVPETKDYDPCCLWMDKGMSFHISEAASKYMGFSPYKIGKSESFDKTDLVFVKKPSFYDGPVICVKGGTLKNPDVGEKLCVESYKGIPLPLDRKAGLLCVEKQWWLGGGICGAPGKDLEVSGSPPMPCSGECYPDGKGGCTALKSYSVPSDYECICVDSNCVKK